MVTSSYREIFPMTEAVRLIEKEEKWEQIMYQNSGGVI